ncbi:MAG: very short patch repair endonuclease [Bacillota bacterium]|nr:very short patch repair endonuclease [Bacillota bacterium]
MKLKTSEARSRNMSAIKSKNTKPEIIIRKALHAAGFRYRLHQKDLPGKPDLYLPKYKTVIFVHGCFWHQHEGCKDAVTPKTNTEFWKKKLNGNVYRDKENIIELEKMGLKVIIVWECTINECSKNNEITKLVQQIQRILKNEDK